MFAKAMINSNNNMSSTWNGALSLSSPDPSGNADGLISLLFKCVRGITDEQINEYLSKATKENLVDSFLIAFNTRDVRGGKGERDIGRKLLVYLFLNHPSEFNKVYHLIPEYGRFDDLLVLFPNVIEKEKLTLYHLAVQKDIVKFFSTQLKTDKTNMEEGKPVSLCAKWAPTEGDSLDKKYKLVRSLCSDLGITSKQYRKEYTTPLRAYLHIVETYMCSNNWEKIEFSKVPSCAVKRLKKAFVKHLPESYKEWLDSLKNGTSKVNAKALHPHELVKEMRTKNEADQVCTSQWNVLEEEVRKLGSLQDAVVVVDTSGSMTCNNSLPLDIACGLGLMIASVVEGEFKNHVITFDDTPTFQVIKEGDIYSRYQQLRDIPWGGSTNLQATFDLILEKGRAAKLTDKDMPKRLFIISDMQFDSAVGDRFGEQTNLEVINDKYKLYGYTRPQIVFWNANGSSTDFPASTDDDGTVLVSGTSPAILKSIITAKEFSTYAIMRAELDSERYKPVKESLCGGVVHS